jgi:hypothetical protein
MIRMIKNSIAAFTASNESNPDHCGCTVEGGGTG